jgi:hypothetical protein
MNKEEMLKIVDENIAKLKNKEYTLYFFVLDTKGNPSHSLEYIYHTALTLMKRGHKVVMLHQEAEFVGVADWLGEEYASIPHMNIETENVEVSPSDFIFIPEIFANVMMQTKKMPCKKVVIVQNYSNICEFMPVSHTLETLGIIDVVTTSKFQEEKVKSFFPSVRTHVVSPSTRKAFRDNTDVPRKLIINLIVKEQSDANRITKPFYWKNPLYRWVSFRDLRGLSKDVLAEALREGAITIWVDDKTDFGTSLIESVKCGGIVIAKIPERLQDWMKNGEELTNSVLWFNDIDEVSDVLPSVIRSWTTDTVPNEVYENQKELKQMFTEDVQELEIIEAYEKNIINRRLSDFEEAKADIKNNVNNEE